MAYTQTDADTLRAAIASGVRRVSFENKTVEYQDMSAMRAALKDIQAELDAAAGTTRSRVILVQHDRGL
jgi:hypothetical protein